MKAVYVAAMLITTSVFALSQESSIMFSKLSDVLTVCFALGGKPLNLPLDRAYEVG